jgi:hypothetical protein
VKIEIVTLNRRFVREPPIDQWKDRLGIEMVLRATHQAPWFDERLGLTTYRRSGHILEFGAVSLADAHNRLSDLRPFMELFAFGQGKGTSQVRINDIPSEQYYRRLASNLDYAVRVVIDSLKRSRGKEDRIRRVLEEELMLGQE